MSISEASTGSPNGGEQRACRQDVHAAREIDRPSADSGPGAQRPGTPARIQGLEPRASPVARGCRSPARPADRLGCAPARTSVDCPRRRPRCCRTETLLRAPRHHRYRSTRAYAPRTSGRRGSHGTDRRRARNRGSRDERQRGCRAGNPSPVDSAEYRRHLHLPLYGMATVGHASFSKPSVLSGQLGPVEPRSPRMRGSRGNQAAARAHRARADGLGRRRAPARSWRRA